MLRSLPGLGPSGRTADEDGARGGSLPSRGSGVRPRWTDRGRGEAHGGLPRPRFRCVASAFARRARGPRARRWTRAWQLLIRTIRRHPGSGLRRARVSPESGFRSGNALKNACVSQGSFEQSVDHPARYCDRARSDLVATSRDLIKVHPGQVSIWDPCEQVPSITASRQPSPAQNEVDV